LIENAAKGGWLKVTAGLITGKQFILYRNPTFIGSGPECPIYLFRDPKVGKRHAAVHIVLGGFEIENLPLGADTLINGKSVKRARLRAGDVIQVGATKFLFQEKMAKA
jgi:predicted component of type VI protein secretion system